MDNIENISSQAESQNLAFENEQTIKNSVAQDIKLIENLVGSGAMTQELGHNLVNFISQKAFEKYCSIQAPKTEISTPEFYKQDGRNEVFDYLKSTNVNFDDDEISKISSLVEKIENAAIERYQRAKEHEKTLNNENESAKQRLRANAQNSVSDGTKNMVFTREQIGKMSGAEFAKYERTIMDQLKKGLIK
jgi:hypothetical protein